MDFSRFLICPVCAAPLRRDGGSLFCDGRTGKRHCYDIAAAGYVNLLPPGRQGNAHTGDDREMLAARSRFLAGGYYDGISDTAAALLAEVLPPDISHVRLADAGAGEGYHTCRIAAALTALRGCTVEGCGIDASSRGAAAGAKRARGLGETTHLSFVAGNIFHLPIADAALDCMLSLFAPIPAAEAARTLTDRGILLVAASGREHLYEMRSLLYDEVRENTAEVPVPDGFALVKKTAYREKIRIPSQAVLDDLFMMTPFYYRTPRAGRDRLAHAGAMTVTVAVDFYAYVKASGREKERTV